MENIGLDVHKRETQVCVLTEAGELREERLPPSRILLEASTESEWIAQLFEGLGHGVIVADPGFAPMYGRTRRVIKTDRRDALALAEADPLLGRLQTVPMIGPITALAFVATVADVTRFATAGQVQAYLGLVPRERSSADQQHRGAITKAGPTRVRWLLVEAAWRIRRSTRPEAVLQKARSGPRNFPCVGRHRPALGARE